MITSFGYTTTGPPSRVDKVFDVRSLTHKESDPAFKGAILDIVKYGQEHPGASIAVGCEKGLHRSKVIAHAVASRLRQSVFHRE